MGKNRVIVVQNINITVSEGNFDDYICITDIAKAKVGDEDVSRRTIALSIRTGKLTARVLASALRAAGRKIQKERRARQTPHGRQSVKKLIPSTPPKSPWSFASTLSRPTPPPARWWRTSARAPAQRPSPLAGKAYNSLAMCCEFCCLILQQIGLY